MSAALPSARPPIAETERVVVGLRPKPLPGERVPCLVAPPPFSLPSPPLSVVTRSLARILTHVALLWLDLLLPFSFSVSLHSCSSQRMLPGRPPSPDPWHVQTKTHALSDPQPILPACPPSLHWTCRLPPSPDPHPITGTIIGIVWAGGDGEHDYTGIAIVVLSWPSDPNGTFRAVPLVDDGCAESIRKKGRHIPMPAQLIEVSDTNDWYPLAIKDFEELIRLLVREGKSHSIRKQHSVVITCPLSSAEHAVLIAISMKKLGRGIEHIQFIDCMTMHKMGDYKFYSVDTLLDYLQNNALGTGAHLDHNGYMTHYRPGGVAWWELADSDVHVNGDERVLVRQKADGNPRAMPPAASNAAVAFTLSQSPMTDGEAPFDASCPEGVRAGHPQQEPTHEPSAAEAKLASPCAPASPALSALSDNDQASASEHTECIEPLPPHTSDSARAERAPGCSHEDPVRPHPPKAGHGSMPGTPTSPATRATAATEEPSASETEGLDRQQARSQRRRSFDLDSGSTAHDGRLLSQADVQRASKERKTQDAKWKAAVMQAAEVIEGMIDKGSSPDYYPPCGSGSKRRRSVDGEKLLDEVMADVRERLLLPHLQSALAAREYEEAAKATLASQEAYQFHLENFKEARANFQASRPSY